jgi:hypothetical protein
MYKSFKFLENYVVGVEKTIYGFCPSSSWKIMWLVWRRESNQITEMIQETQSN